MNYVILYYVTSLTHIEEKHNEVFLIKFTHTIVYPTKRIQTICLESETSARHTMSTNTVTIDCCCVHI